MREFLSAASLIALYLSPAAEAVVIGTEQFSGDLTETWEGFPNFLDGPFTLASTTSIMNGAATITHSSMIIYEPGTANFGLVENGMAAVADGTKAMGLDVAGIATIAFAHPVTAFGAFWGACSYGGAATVSLTFSDNSTASFSYTRPADGALEWHGWTSTVGISSISYSGDFVVIDGLQAISAAANTSVAVPDGGSALALLGIAFAGVVGFRRKLG